ncbi:NADH dehydrogenase [Ligilactobacillus pabuli]|uniref:NADH dehydrogenase n=1 Tax=Ligilactobacillus pabuli TaxID=2886039 RepID=A0ABQ5JHZ8_9LACO|nr:NAD(P)/FAD-dependent oxidoreductase [Ligilactobacillus pabuli]GKS81711.1 NADH dehydrogenase [Ligilactobacillus pabuli]
MKEIVILGGGYAGLRALKFLQGSKGGFHVTLVDRNDYHYEATDLHEVAAGTQPAEKILFPIEDVVDTDVTTFVQATVEKIDRDKREVSLDNGETLSYDYIIIGLGFRSESFGIAGVDENSLPMVDVNTALDVYDHIVAQLEDYKQTHNPDDLKIVVCGAGFTGIELLGALNDNRAHFAEIADVAPERIEIYVVEAVTRLLPMMPEELADYGIAKLESWGIKFLTGKPIKEIKPSTVVYQTNAETGETDELTANTIIWTTGVSGSKVIDASGFSARRGRMTVDSDLRDPEYRNVYLVGDCSAVMDPESNRPYPTTAQISLVMGELAAKNILNQLAGRETGDFTYESQGTVASIGNTHAFGVLGNGKSVKGYAASALKKVIMNKSLIETGGTKTLFAKGRFDLYH